MKRIIALVAAALALGSGIVGVVAVTPAAAFVATYTANLAATNEVPPNATGYVGNATITIDSQTNEVCVLANTNVPDTDPIILQHIHQAPAGVNGPIVIPFTGLIDCETADPTLVTSILNDPAGFYFNVHTTAFPAGALRGQLVLQGAPVIDYHADLAATNEVPPNATGYTGNAAITVNTTTFEVCVNATTNVPNSDPIILQHIHQAPAGVNGPIVIPFSSLNSCATATGSLVANIVADPAGFYFNVHTQAFPAGALRGQLVLGALPPPPPPPPPPLLEREPPPPPPPLRLLCPRVLAARSDFPLE
jgi:CHRD domain